MRKKARQADEVELQAWRNWWGGKGAGGKAKPGKAKGKGNQGKKCKSKDDGGNNTVVKNFTKQHTLPSPMKSKIREIALRAAESWVCARRRVIDIGQQW